MRGRGRGQRRTAPLVSASGSATTVALTLLDPLAMTGCVFAYHGDFDWPGITLANRVMQRYAAESWRMRAAEYEYLATRAQVNGTPRSPSRTAGRGAVGHGTHPRYGRLRHRHA